MVKTFSDRLSAQAYAESQKKETAQQQEVIQIEADVFVVIKKESKDNDLPAIWRPVLRIRQPGGKLDRCAIVEKTQSIIRTIALRKQRRLSEIDREMKRIALLEQEKEANDKRLKEEVYRLKIELNERKHRNQRAKELAEQASRYKEMSIESLSSLWESRNDQLDSDKIEVLRKVIRQKMGFV